MIMKIYVKLFVFLIIASTISSCISRRYDFKSKDKLNNIEVYKDPTITKRISIGTYISVIGVPIGSSILLGNHAYQNAIENGSPKDTASMERNTIYGLGVLAAGLGAYYLAKDTAYPKTEQLRDLEEVKEWYANTVDFDQNVFLGYYNKGKHTYVLSSKQEDYAKVYVKDISELRLITEIIDLNQNKNMLIKTVVDNSIDKIPSKDLFEAYIITDRKYPILLHRQLENTQNQYVIRSTVMELKTLGLLSDTRLANLGAIKYLESIDKNNQEDISDWLDLFKNIHSITIDGLRNELMSSKEQLEVDNNIKSEEKLAKENIIFGNCREEIEEYTEYIYKLGQHLKSGYNVSVDLNNMNINLKYNNRVIKSQSIYDETYSLFVVNESTVLDEKIKYHFYNNIGVIIDSLISKLIIKEHNSIFKYIKSIGKTRKFKSDQIPYFLEFTLNNPQVLNNNFVNIMIEFGFFRSYYYLDKRLSNLFEKFIDLLKSNPKSELLLEQPYNNILKIIESSKFQSNYFEVL